MDRTMTTTQLAPALRIIATGGTFDKAYNPLTGSLGFTDPPASSVPALIAQARTTAAITCQTLMQIDSLDMQDSHRQHVLQACREAPETVIVIVHGTDTMPETAQVLGQAGLQKTVVLTGAMVPASVNHSDALFNLGFAIAAAQTLAPGVYVAMNAVIRPWNDVRKNRALGVFEANAPKSAS
jgi:L-asparaginase